MRAREGFSHESHRDARPPRARSTPNQNPLVTSVTPWRSLVPSWLGGRSTARAALFVVALLTAVDASAQLAAPNQAGVAMGHLHYTVKDVDANRQFWVALGGTAKKIGSVDAVSFPDVIVMLSPGTPSGNSDGAVVNHVAFRVRTFAQVEAAGLKVARLAQFPGVGSTMSPEGERIELFEDAALNLGFVPDQGKAEGIVDRHNKPLATPTAFHHIHLYLPGEAHLDAKAWYAKMFGGVTGKRSTYDAVDLPGINLNLSGGRATAPTKGRMLDHIGFEVRNLEAFCKRLASMGVKFDVPFQKGPNGVSSAVLTDPWGTTIELTEGLSTS
jgi:catechol 2,3-dioxygenase-like lactoylglutathione lyase family enzyme